MTKEFINKIIYFDKETIRNLLQEKNQGSLEQKSNVSTSKKIEGSVSTDASAKIQLNVPFISRISFLFTGKIESSYIKTDENTTTISSTEISEFNKLKSSLVEIKDAQLSDIENSSTSFRVASTYIKITKDEIDGVNTKEFERVLNSFDGYDTYKIDKNRYVRFNNSAFVSNYKRNDLLLTTMTLYCIPVGEFEKNRFDFIKQLEKMDQILTSEDSPKSLADVYPAKINSSNDCVNSHLIKQQNDNNDIVTLYDVIYSSITAEVPNEK